MNFQQFLEDRGYIKHILSTNTMKFHLSGKNILSSSGVLDYTYIHKSDKNLLDKISKGLSCGEGITWKDREKVIIWGLHERRNPPTLISPRPSIYIITENTILTDNDDAGMNRALQKFEYSVIYKAMFNKKIDLILDYTKL